MESPSFIAFISSLNASSLWFVVKIIYLVAYLIYICFSVVVLSQIKQMGKTFIGGLEKPLQLFGSLHVLLAVLAFFWAFMVL
jgi:hypothetical protein